MRRTPPHLVAMEDSITCLRQHPRARLQRPYTLKNAVIATSVVLVTASLLLAGKAEDIATAAIKANLPVPLITYLPQVVFGAVVGGWLVAEFVYMKNEDL